MCQVGGLIRNVECGIDTRIKYTYTKIDDCQRNNQASQKKWLA